MSRKKKGKGSADMAYSQHNKALESMGLTSVFRKQKLGLAENFMEFVREVGHGQEPTTAKPGIDDIPHHISLHELQDLVGLKQERIDPTFLQIKPAVTLKTTPLQFEPRKAEETSAREDLLRPADMPPIKPAEPGKPDLAPASCGGGEKPIGHPPQPSTPPDDNILGSTSLLCAEEDTAVLKIGQGISPVTAKPGAD